MLWLLSAAPEDNLRNGSQKSKKRGGKWQMQAGPYLFSGSRRIWRYGGMKIDTVYLSCKSKKGVVK